MLLIMTITILAVLEVELVKSLVVVFLVLLAMTAPEESYENVTAKQEEY